ncbi:MAG: hypothetical protein U5P10_08575 [Spirochaetia bacterium]|nr:hypothetical protein [Spirochaetia bacterium]
MNSKGQDERQHEHRQQRTESRLNPYRPAGRIRTIFVIILVVLLLSGTAWYLALQRQVVILTDPVWKSAYLEPEHTAEQLKINLLNHFYLPRIVSIPFEQAGQAELEAICRSRRGAWFLLSPYLSSLIEPATLLQACSGSNLVVWETAAGSEIGSQNALTSTLPSESKSETQSESQSELSPDATSRLTVLYLDPQRLARAMGEGLAPLISSSKSSSESTTESNGRPIQLVWSRDGHFSEDFAVEVHTELAAQLTSQEVILVDISEQRRDELNSTGQNSTGSVGEGNSLEITSEALLVILDGEPEALKELLTRIENRGARAVVFGNGALSGWPTGVKASDKYRHKNHFQRVAETCDEFTRYRFRSGVLRFAFR